MFVFVYVYVCLLDTCIITKSDHIALLRPLSLHLTLMVQAHSGRAAEDLVSPADARANLIVLRLGVTGRVELGLHAHEYTLREIKDFDVALTRDARSEPPNQTAYLEHSMY